MKNKADADGGDLLAQKAGMLKFARATRLLLNGSAAALVLVFGWLKLRGVDFTPIAKSLPVDIVFKSTLALYYACWVAGLQSDINDQELLYIKAPNEGRIPFGGFATAFIVTTLFGILCYTDSYSKFAVVLAAFFSINVISWFYLVKLVLPPAVEASKAYYYDKNNYAALEQVRLLYDQYLRGAWQWARFFVGAIIVLMIIWMSFYGIPSVIASRVEGVSTESLIALTILLFVLVMESWNWIMRLRLKSGLRLMEKLASIYDLVPVTTA
jgi:hypothetical protein